MTVPKAYWITTYRAITNPDALVAYAKLAGPAIKESGGRFLARGNPAKIYEAGLNHRVVVIEFENTAKAFAAYRTTAYQAALEALGDGAERDIRICRGRHVSWQYEMEGTMAKAYWVVSYRSIANPAARGEYTKLAVPAVLAHGGRYFTRGNPAKTYEAGIALRTVVDEFNSPAQAIAAY